VVHKLLTKKCKNPKCGFLKAIFLKKEGHEATVSRSL